MLLSIIIPAYNEEKRIPLMLDRYLEFYEHNEVEFIVVLNGCLDNTRSVVQSYIDRHSANILMIEISEAIGKGGAIRQGFQVAKGDLIGFVDADGATEPSEFNKVVAALDGHDGAIASRWKKGSQAFGKSFLRKVISLGFIFFVKLIFWMPYFDTQCGAKVFTRAAIKQILLGLSVNNMAFDVELLYRCKQAGFSVIEVPTLWVDKSSSTLMRSPFGFIKNGAKMLITILRIRFT